MTTSSIGALARARDELAPALASALLFALAFPPFPAVAAAALCLVPAAVAVARLADTAGSWHAAARVGFWFGALGFGLNTTWIVGALTPYTRLALLAFVGVVASLGVLVGGCLAVLHRARSATRLPLVVLLPIVWVALEVVLERIPELAFPWLPLGLATTGALPIAQLAEVGGVHALSFLIAALNGLIADAVLTGRGLRSWAPRLAAAAAVIGLAYAGGERRLRSLETRELASVAIVQPNIAQAVRWRPSNRDSIVARHAALTRVAFTHSPDLIVWPESALPGEVVAHRSWSDSVRALAASVRAPILLGTIDSAPPSSGGRWYNAAMLAEPGRMFSAQSPYYKAHLVPLIERTPLTRVGSVFGIPYFGSYVAGGSARPFELPFGRTGVLICFESTFAQRAREQRAHGAALLVAITNDAWFGWSNAGIQHLAHLVLRAIETRAPVVRAANTGISAYIDPTGRVHEPTQRFVPAVRAYAVRTSDVSTVYTASGDIVGLSCAALTALLAMWRSARTRQA
ncbi:MAG TPA: apolipoprotein N-acyltransferase [Gemmatimonadaceae bacterium]|nr:apolipoprotein N-acyltransferase [Gemmatimonadaceae bacterium]